MERIEKSFTGLGKIVWAKIKANNYTRKMLEQKYQAVSVVVKAQRETGTKLEKYTITVVYEKRVRPRLKKIDAICSCVAERQVTHRIGRKDCLSFALYELLVPGEKPTYGGVILY